MIPILRWMLLGMVLTALLWGCAPKLPVRFQDSGYNNAFRYTGMAYPEYVAHMRRVIGSARQDLTAENRERVIDWNSPYILEPAATCPKGKDGRYPAGVLLIHGLTDSPFVLRDIAAHLQQRCYLVYGLLLPGHGTVPGDLLKVTVQEWEKATAYGLEALRPRVERLYAGGFSTGGGLLVKAVFEGAKVDGLLLFAPALELEGKAFLARPAASVKQWLDIAPDEDPTKYESFPTNAAAQVYALTHALSFKLDNAPFATPLFVAVSEDDQTIEPDAVVRFFTRVGDGISRIVLYGRGGKPQDLRFIPVNSAFPKENVLNMGHLSLAVSPENPHYGRNGDYRNCLHYLDEPKAWKACKTGNVPAGETTPDNLKQGVLRRLTYNPDFTHMLQELDAFLERVQRSPRKA